jgi:hypothetical protein
MLEAAQVTCPYCGESVEISVDLSAGRRQNYIEDCQVCCRPWQVQVRVHSHSDFQVQVFAENESSEAD